jgi:hypothetical protein
MTYHQSSNCIGRTTGILFLMLAISFGVAGRAKAQTKEVLRDRLLATHDYMKEKMWDGAGNFMRRADMPAAQSHTDSWGVTIVIDAYSYLVELGFLKPEDLKAYYKSSTAVYQRTEGGIGARILAQQGDQIYVGGDDDLQWISALVHAYNVTKDVEYLNAAKGAFNALIHLGFWKSRPVAGWQWNSAKPEPVGVSTAYGALAAARLYEAAGDSVYRLWADVSLAALPKVGVTYIPRDKLVAVQAMVTLAKKTGDKHYLAMAEQLAKQAIEEAWQTVKGKRKGEVNPTDVGDLSEGLFALASALPATRGGFYKSEAEKFTAFFIHNRTSEDIKSHGFYSRYNPNGEPILEGNYIGVPVNVQFLPEVAEMLKLGAVLLKYQ